MTTARLAARAARLETAMNAAVTRVTAALPSISAEEAAAALEAAVPVTMKGQGPAWFLEELAAHMTAHPDALTLGKLPLPAGAAPAGPRAARGRAPGVSAPAARTAGRSPPICGSCARKGGSAAAAIPARGRTGRAAVAAPPAC